ncbi:hypothetical protein bcere0013_55410 [Bacillus cereus BDRD-ST26]|uniref:Uncharacterized protein n=1 Tax=Bacillus cereus (strain AH187) TaxID=405534 RepID=B7HW70_BACC7|nr:hypothetical protein BCAH187_A5303 [Bacillus cereus AH187]EEK97320.1 hypothetical protein bcere0013_55410 [Bacillus cereus BDRD-ST26]
MRNEELNALAIKARNDENAMWQVVLYGVAPLSHQAKLI